MFDVAQGLWNSVVGKNFFVDARFGLNKILFPTYQNGGNQQSTTDNATGIVYGNFPTDTIRNRDRLSSQHHRQYYVDQALGGRHEIKFGFDYSHAVTKNQNAPRRRRDDDLHQRERCVRAAERDAVRHAAERCDGAERPALFAQDSFSLRRLTVIGGLRFEQLEGYLPAQSSPPSQFATANIGGFAAQPRSYDEVRDIVKWNTVGPRISAMFDISGDGKTAAKASAGRYYYVLSTGGGGVSNVNRNGTYSENYTWIDREQRSKVPDRRTDGHAGGQRGRGQRRDSHVDRSGFQPALHRRVQLRRGPRADGQRQAERGVHLPPRKEHAGDGESGQPVRDHADERGRSGYRRRGRHRPTTAPTASSSASRRRIRAVITNDPNVVQSYKGLEITLTKRLSNRWQMLAGYTLLEEPDRQHQRRCVTEFPDQRERQHYVRRSGHRIEQVQRVRRGKRRPAEPVQAHRDVPPAVPRRDHQRQPPVAAGTGVHAPDQPRARVRRGPDDQPRAARQHAYRHADHDRPAGRQAVQVRTTAASRPRWTSTTWPTPTPCAASAR